MARKEANLKNKAKEKKRRLVRKIKKPTGVYSNEKEKETEREGARARHETAAAEKPGPMAEEPQTARRTANADHGRGNVMDEVHHDVGRHECRDHD